MKTISKLIIAIPILGAFIEALGTILEKRILRKKKVNNLEYNFFAFLSIVVMLIPLILVLYYFSPEKFPLKVAEDAFLLKNILILLGIVIISVVANLLIFYTLKWEKVTEIEPIRLLQPLFAIVLALFIFSSERNIKASIITASLIASLALILSHIKKHHISFNKYALAGIFGSFFFALELILTNFILKFYPPLVFYFIRCFGILIIGFIIYRPKIETIDKKTWRLIMGASFLWIAYRLLLYTTYLKEGVITTTLLFMLTPVFVYIMSYFYLKEKPNWRNIITALVIVACVGYAMLVS